MAEELLPVGAEAPDFEAPTTDGGTVKLAHFRGTRSVLLMFYPKDDTPGCTRQMCTARDEGAEYEAAGVRRFGVNPGSLESHRKFADKYMLDFPLIVDEHGDIARAFGVLKENGGVARATFLIDRDGRVAFSAPGAHGAEEVLGAVRG
ncbi:peroxiredoxin [Longimicrobium sp.]|uniref:peroxiredoxin n=1 Tax=Longimicrobium sp. TaxID=2029185 RepID=UPI002B53F74B|nr:peroxiredoxin [Longimicrobium sp.]HSU16483.1 peroxiredoxin [Longimicrobium sp.]